MNNCGLVCRGVRLESRFQRAASSMANMGVISGMHALRAEQVRGIRVESAKTVAYRIGSCKQCRSMCGGSRSDVRKQEALRQGSKEERSNHGVGWIEDARNVQEVSSNPEACAFDEKSSDRNLPCFSNTHTLYQSIQVPVRAQRSDPGVTGLSSSRQRASAPTPISALSHSLPLPGHSPVLVALMLAAR